MSPGDPTMGDEEGKERLHEELKGSNHVIEGKDLPTYLLPFQEVSTNRYRLGEDHEDDRCLNVILLGVTGSGIMVPWEKKKIVWNVLALFVAGKSMLEEAMGNYVLGVDFQDPYRFQVKKEHGPTASITSYTFFTRDKQKIPCPITIIDTPGFQKGTPEEDQRLMEDIRDFIHSNYPLGIHAVAYVVPVSQGRLTAEQKMVLENMAEVLEEEFSNNSYLFCTFADGKLIPVLESLKESRLAFKSNFPVNSSAYFAKENEEQESSEDDGRRKSETNVRSINELLWKVTTDSIQEFIQAIQMNNPIQVREPEDPSEKKDEVITIEDASHPPGVAGESVPLLSGTSNGEGSARPTGRNLALPEGGESFLNRLRHFVIQGFKTLFNWIPEFGGFYPLCNLRAVRERPDTDIA
ncbi:unnamed protein product [Darwinula stevensoni]|uniref:AIG1-type G domain-containing protein n=1 Tax=Darwinula stevensoni TaxID=69355 RepID=A0A7R8XEW1_9CRUS|nr:unnamed protein product [Darwinula stevensoni]CAG0888222.1 unnamed protein product [Darwinula stevensoni]